MVADNNADTADTDAARTSESLYDWWLGVVPALLGGPAPGTGTDTGADPARPSDDKAPRPFPIDRMSVALTSTQELLTTLFTTCARTLLAADRPDGKVQAQALQGLVQGGVAGLTERLAAVGQALSADPERAAPAAGSADTSLEPIAAALKPLLLNLERTYGGVADAFGLAPLRELGQAGRDMSVAVLGHRQAQAGYLEVVAEALGKGAAALTARLAEMGGRGESVDSLLALTRLWAQTTDAAMHDAMQSPRALGASARLIRASARSRQQQQRVVAIVSEALNVPTRAEVDAAYREIQELKRELRRLRKAGSTVTPLAASKAISLDGRHPAAPRAAKTTTAARNSSRKPSRSRSKEATT